MPRDSSADSTTAPPSSASSPSDDRGRGLPEGTLALLAGLADPAQRRAAARDLARNLGAEDLLLFVADPEVRALLPAPGFPQTLAGARAWRAFLAETAARGQHDGQLPNPETGATMAAHGGATMDGSGVLILLGGNPRREELGPVVLLLPLLVALTRGERAASAAAAQSTLAREAAASAGALAAALDAARRELQHSLRTRQEFLAAASHDLKNPLGAIKGIAQLLKRQAARPAGVDPERLRAGLESIDAAVTHMTSLVDELLDAARIRLGEPLELRREATDLAALARETATEYQQATERHRLHVVADAPVVGRWDAVRLERVLGNLVGNAIKYSPAGGEISVRVERQAAPSEAWAVLAVQDQGLGIPAADLPYVFEPFRRADNVIGRIAGTGVGLAAARRIVEQHGGTIAAASQEGSGSTFTVRLPLEPGDETEERTRAAG